VAVSFIGGENLSTQTDMEQYVYLYIRDES